MATIDACVAAGVLREYLQECRKEVIDMMQGIMDPDEAMESYKKELRQEGLEQGIERTRIETVRNAMGNLSLSAEQAMDALGIPQDARGPLIAALS